jgi:homoserine dehydrogenase
MVEDHPGVMAQITGVIGRHGVSIASVIQHEANEDGATPVVPLVIMTHATTEGATAAAVEEIDRLPCVHQRCVRLRVLD